MAGKPGRSGGHNRLTVEQHLIRGSYRKDRHGPLPDKVLPMPMPTSKPDWQPTEAEMEELGPRSQAMLQAVLGLYRLDPVEGATALLAMRAYSRMEALEAAISEHGMVDDDGAPRTLLAALAREQRSFVAAWSLLRLGK